MTYRFHTNDVVLTVPQGFRDRSSQVLEWPNPSGQPLHLIMTRLEKRASELEKELAAAIRDLEITFHGLSSVDPPPLTTNFPLGQFACRFRREDKVFYQRLIFIGAESYILSIATIGPASQRSEIDDLTQNAIQNLLFRAND